MKHRKILLSWMLLCIGLAVAAQEEPVSYDFAVLGDMHYAAAYFYPDLSGHPKRKSIRKYIRMWEHGSHDLLRAAGQTAGAAKARFVIQLGDLTNGECPSGRAQEEMFRRAFGIVKSCFPKIPLYTVIGNHDVRLQNGSSADPVRKALLPLAAKELGSKKLQSGNYGFRIGQDLFIALDCFTADEDPADFVCRTLSENPDTRYVFLLTHYPLFPASIRSSLSLVPKYARIISLLEKRRAVILAAHTHCFSRTTLISKQGRLTQLVVASLGASWRNEFWRRKLLGNRLKMVDSWPGYVAKIKKRSSGKKESAALLSELDDIEARGTYETEHYAEQSGFVIIKVSDRRIQAEIYLDDGGSPGLSLDLL